MDTKHTPGPWWFSRDDAEGVVFTVGAGDYRLATVYGEATSRLIAAAPELLEAARMVLSDLEHYGVNHKDGPDVRLAALKAAIAKAEGL